MKLEAQAETKKRSMEKTNVIYERQLGIMTGQEKRNTDERRK